MIGLPLHVESFIESVIGCALPALQELHIDPLGSLTRGLGIYGVYIFTRFYIR